MALSFPFVLSMYSQAEVGVLRGGTAAVESYEVSTCLSTPSSSTLALSTAKATQAPSSQPVWPLSVGGGVFGPSPTSVRAVVPNSGPQVPPTVHIFIVTLDKNTRFN